MFGVTICPDDNGNQGIGLLVTNGNIPEGESIEPGSDIIFSPKDENNAYDWVELQVVAQSAQTWTLEVLSGDTVLWSQTGTGQQTIQWKGQDNNGNWLGDGAYTVRLTSGNDVITQEVKIDNSQPEFTEPIIFPELTLQGKIDKNHITIYQFVEDPIVNGVSSGINTNLVTANLDWNQYRADSTVVEQINENKALIIIKATQLSSTQPSNINSLIDLNGFTIQAITRQINVSSADRRSNKNVTVSIPDWVGAGRIKIKNGPCKMVDPDRRNLESLSRYSLYEIFDFDHRQNKDTRDVTLVFVANSSNYSYASGTDKGDSFISSIEVYANNNNNVNLKNGGNTENIEIYLKDNNNNTNKVRPGYLNELKYDQLTDSIYNIYGTNLGTSLPLSMLSYFHDDMADPKGRQVTFVSANLSELDKNQKDVFITVKFHDTTNPNGLFKINSLTFKLEKAPPGSGINWKVATCY